MQLNRIQQQIFASLCKDHQMDLDAYIATYSQKYLGEQVASAAEFTEEQADEWITKVYIQSIS